MKRFLLPVIAASLLAGCVYGDYAYRGYGNGDYYHGRPYVDYRYYGGYYGGYGGYYGGYYPYGYYRYSYPGYRYPHYGYGYPYGGYYPGRPYYYPYRNHHPYRPYRPPVVDRPDHDGRDHHPRSHDRDGGPWRNLGRIPPGTAPRTTSPNVSPRNNPPNFSQPRAVMPARPAPEVRNDSGTRAGTMRRAEPTRRRGDSVSRQEP